MTEDVFDYKCDWVNYFSQILKKEIYVSDAKIKGSIVESNQKNIDNLIKTLESDMDKSKETIELIGSKESNFYNIRIKDSAGTYLFYVDTSNPRFWIVHNIEKSEISNKMSKKISNSYLQDSTYFTDRNLWKYLELEDNVKSKGFTMQYDQRFSNDDENAIIESTKEGFTYYGITLKIWEKRENSIGKLIENLNKINFPLNYTTLNYSFFEDGISDTISMKEELSFDGNFTIIKGNDMRRHLNFIKKVRDDYSDKMEKLEANRIDWKECKSGLYEICWNDELKIDPKLFVQFINKSVAIFKINAFFIRSDGNYCLYNCVDTHTGGPFFLQVFPNKLVINLGKRECGNIILRMYVNLKRYFSPSCILLVDDDKYDNW